ncbi:DNA-binding protein [Streptomyces sp. NPDC096354]|uniref:DNA-binding protein n=1 Tax=Streptomyces sp. NPDC096354 TaxID=3366088 RepID=UPI0038178D4A
MTPRNERRCSELLRVARVGDDAWLPQHEAARQLDIAVHRVGVLIACGHLVPAENAAGSGGVTLASVQAEKTWRDNATYRERALRLLKDTVGFF